jgi:2-polyprenyl-3-methyl-5-hydroxy-6-metoxy-1,4-benzoquinol methylase
VRYRKDGATGTSRQLVSAISGGGVEGMTLLDIGGGVGTIQHALLEKGVSKATHVDASSAYVQAARKEAKSRKLEDRITILQGDYIDLAKDIPEVDLVTLDRVVCCYDEMEPLVQRSAEKARKKYGLVFPRDLWIFRIFLPLVNAILSLRGTPFRIFLHSTRRVDQIIREQGFSRIFYKRAGFWQILVYSRSE